jgi:hypothetical protein
MGDLATDLSDEEVLKIRDTIRELAALALETAAIHHSKGPTEIPPSSGTTRAKLL